ncbi:WD40-repeat-containing domain protein, partial [Ochromonadaceae sp. CCMP2298]
TSPKRKEIYTYQAPWTTYTMAWSRSPERKCQMALGSYIEEYPNQFQIIELQRDERGNGQFSVRCQFEHPYPATKVMWAPSKHYLAGSDLLATTGDYLRLWNLSSENTVEMKGVLNNNKHPEYCAPLTSFDWNETDPAIIGTCSIDTTCTIWDINAMTPKTQLIAHDKEVYDIAFACGKDIFGTVGADGSLRMFDLRSLEHSTILYESPDLTPLLKLSWNKQDPNYLATIHTDSNKAIILDIRVPSAPVAELVGHVGALNGIVWAPH